MERFVGEGDVFWEAPPSFGNLEGGGHTRFPNGALCCIPQFPTLEIWRRSALPILPIFSSPDRLPHRHHMSS